MQIIFSLYIQFILNNLCFEKDHYNNQLQSFQHEFRS